MPSQLRFENWLWGVRRDTHRRAFNTFTCPNCEALYQVVEVEAGPDREITCQVCGGPLAGREGDFVLKYYLLRKGIQRRRHGTTATN